jgi:DNA (cytosine-5)-methyltransferase 1
MSRRGATLFSGGGGVEALLKQSIDFVHAVEYDPAIAGVYRQNHGDHVQVASVCDVDYSLWGALDYLHASPVCKEFSQAKSGGSESSIDIDSALAVARCLEQTAPRVFTLENVGAYARSQSYRLICHALDRLGYMWHAEVLNSADFGVPQTRRRLILRAVKDALLPGLAAPDPWVGWYAAIEDIIDTLPDSQFAPWQLERLPNGICDTSLLGAGGFRDEIPRVECSEPSFAVTSTHASQVLRAFIVHSTDQRSMSVRDEGEPTFTVMSFSYKDSHAPGGMPRAFLVDGDGDGNRSREPTILDQDAPSMTIQAWHGRRPIQSPRAWLEQGRVVRMTPRALARFQSFPDSYVLPSKAALACTVIGNAVPCLMIQKIVEPLL